MTRLHTDRRSLPLPPVAVGAGFLLVMILLVTMSFSRTEPPAFAPTPIAPRPSDSALVGPELVTVDARDASRWTFFSFDARSVIERPGPLDWDIAFRRFQVIVNGGDRFIGRGGAIDLGDVAFDDVQVAPHDGFVATVVRSDSTNAAIQRWYAYSFLSHLLSPKPNVYAIRTADGRYAKLVFLGYYCPGATPGCITFRYVYQGAGGRDFLPAATP